MKQYAMEPESWALEYARGESHSNSLFSISILSQFSSSCVVTHEPLLTFLRIHNQTRLDPPHAPIRFRRRLLLHHGRHHALQHCEDHWAGDDWEFVERQDLIIH